MPSLLLLLLLRLPLLKSRVTFGLPNSGGSVCPVLLRLATGSPHHIDRVSASFTSRQGNVPVNDLFESVTRAVFCIMRVRAVFETGQFFESANVADLDNVLTHLAAVLVLLIWNLG